MGSSPVKNADRHPGPADRPRSGREAGAEERFLTLKEAAEILRLHPRTVREYIRRGELSGRLIGRRWRFRRKELDGFFEAAPAQWEFYRGPERGE
jgi:excisionase family DNA binding protein